MSDWYTEVEGDAPLTQGDILLRFPVIRLLKEPRQQNDGQRTVTSTLEDYASQLSRYIAIKQKDVIVMTQACDLANPKPTLTQITLCPIMPLSAYKEAWEKTEAGKNQTPSKRSWRKHCESLEDGYQWDKFIMNHRDLQGSPFEHHVVMFSQIFTAPRNLTETFISQKIAGNKRLQLNSPYKEHLSQSFARYFMRVGLPTSVAKIWD